VGEEDDKQQNQNAQEQPDAFKKRKRRKPHGGCGSEQPKISRDGLKVTAEFAHAMEGVEQKKVLTAEEVCVIIAE